MPKWNHYWQDFGLCYEATNTPLETNQFIVHIYSSFCKINRRFSGWTNKQSKWIYLPGKTWTQLPSFSLSKQKSSARWYTPEPRMTGTHFPLAKNWEWSGWVKQISCAVKLHLITSTFKTCLGGSMPACSVKVRKYKNKIYMNWCLHTPQSWIIKAGSVVCDCYDWLQQRSAVQKVD